MREIKFRGKCLDDRKWVYGSLIYKHIVPPEPGISMDRIATYILEHELDACEVEVDPDTIGQFTGIQLKGTHLKTQDLYEGDIITSGNAMLEIDYNTNEVGFVARTEEGPYICGLDLTSNNFYHIVGNIHDNPELMEE